MPKKERNLPSSASSVTQQGKNRRYFSPEFDLIVKPYFAASKVTVSVSKKVAKRAVDRNRIKRIIKEALRKISNFDITLVVIVKKNIVNLKSYQIEEKLKRILSR